MVDTNITNLCLDIKLFNHFGEIYRFGTGNLRSNIRNFCFDDYIPYTDPRVSNTYFVIELGPFGDYAGRANRTEVTVTRVSYNDPEGPKTMYMGF
jgi:hypothetical protein